MRRRRSSDKEDALANTSRVHAPLSSCSTPLTPPCHPTQGLPSPHYSRRRTIALANMCSLRVNQNLFASISLQVDTIDLHPRLDVLTLPRTTAWALAKCCKMLAMLLCAWFSKFFEHRSDWAMEEQWQPMALMVTPEGVFAGPAAHGKQLQAQFCMTSGGAGSQTSH